MIDKMISYLCQPLIFPIERLKSTEINASLFVIQVAVGTLDVNISTDTLKAILNIINGLFQSTNQVPSKIDDSGLDYDKLKTLESNLFSSSLQFHLKKIGLCFDENPRISIHVFEIMIRLFNLNPSITSQNKLEVRVSNIVALNELNSPLDMEDELLLDFKRNLGRIDQSSTIQYRTSKKKTLNGLNDVKKSSYFRLKDCFYENKISISEIVVNLHAGSEKKEKIAHLRFGMIVNTHVVSNHPQLTDNEIQIKLPFIKLKIPENSLMISIILNSLQLKKDSSRGNNKNQKTSDESHSQQSKTDWRANNLWEELKPLIEWTVLKDHFNTNIFCRHCQLLINKSCLRLRLSIGSIRGENPGLSLSIPKEKYLINTQGEIKIILPFLDFILEDSIFRRYTLLYMKPIYTKDRNQQGIQISPYWKVTNPQIIESNHFFKKIHEYAPLYLSFLFKNKAKIEKKDYKSVNLELPKENEGESSALNISNDVYLVFIEKKYHNRKVQEYFQDKINEKQSITEIRKYFKDSYYLGINRVSFSHEDPQLINFLINVTFQLSLLTFRKL